MDEAGGAELVHGSGDGIALAEVPGFAGDLAQELPDGDLGGMEGQQLPQHGRLEGRVFFGWGSDFVDLFHGLCYIRAPDADLSPRVLP
jgi:hypothetical protein